MDPAAALAWVVEILTTTPTSLAASCAKTSENGVACGGSARLGAAAINASVSNAARIVLRRPNDLTKPFPYLGARDMPDPGRAGDLALAFPWRSI